MTWKTVKLKEVISHRKGFIDIDDETEYKLVTVKLHRKGVYLRENLKGFKIRTKKQQVCKAGDFIVAEMDAKVGGYGFIPDYLEGAIVSSHYFLFEVNEEKLRPQFLEVVSQLKIIQDQIKAVGSTNYAAIRPYNVLDWEIPLPPIEKQIEIENLYLIAKEKVDHLNTEFADQLTQLENLNQAILQEAVQGKLVPQDKNDEPASELLKRIKAEKAALSLSKGSKKEKPLPPIKPEEIPFEIPENWVWCRLGEISEIKRGKGPKYSEKGIAKMLNQKCIRWYAVDLQYCKSVDEDWFDSISDDFIVKENDVLINSTGDGTIGRSAIAHKEVEGYVFDSHILKLTSIISQMFICYYINSNYGQEQVNKSKGATSTKQHELGVNNLSNFIFPLPSLSEQKRIVAEIEKQFAKTKQLKEHIIANQQATEQLLKTLLHQAFEVREVEDV
ncbi:restriction endonuclease subunit S [Phnomibacter sp. MR]|uniref:restriction endonuclease subunit S n=1 Tax=Phnomibacter sp. MR TaxID=3042318 RepID=UPI003A7FB2F8